MSGNVAVAIARAGGAIFFIVTLALLYRWFGERGLYAGFPVCLVSLLVAEHGLNFLKPSIKPGDGRPPNA